MYPYLATGDVRRALTTNDLGVINNDGGTAPEALLASGYAAPGVRAVATQSAVVTAVQAAPASTRMGVLAANSWGSIEAFTVSLRGLVIDGLAGGQTFTSAPGIPGQGTRVTNPVSDLPALYAFSQPAASGFPFLGGPRNWNLESLNDVFSDNDRTPNPTDDLFIALGRDLVTGPFGTSRLDRPESDRGLTQSPDSRTGKEPDQVANGELLSRWGAPIMESSTVALQIDVAVPALQPEVDESGSDEN
jgi:hypothetical protein